MAKPPMNGRPLLWGSWAGNALLTLLAAYVAFTHTGLLLPGTILTIAVCILAGNLLPLGAHALLYSWDQLAVRAEQAQAGETLRKAIVRLGQAEARLAEARDASAKATLVARQIPDRIEEQFRTVAQSLQNLDTKAVAELDRDIRRCVESLAEATTHLEETDRPDPGETEDAVNKTDEAVSTALAALQSTVERLANELTALREERLATPSSQSEPDSGPVPAQPPAEGSSSEEDTFGDDPDWSVDITGTVDFSDDDDDPFGGIEDELRAADKPAKKASKKRAAKKKAKRAVPGKKDDDPHAELFSTKDMEAEEPPRGSTTILEAHAMIGIHNKLYLRGDPPLLDWDKGTPLDLTGIGEYRWTTGELKNPLTCKLLLNDERWAIGENLVLQPGQTLVTHPKF